MNEVKAFGSALTWIVGFVFALWVLKQLVDNSSLQGRIGGVSFGF